MVFTRSLGRLNILSVESLVGRGAAGGGVVGAVNVDEEDQGVLPPAAGCERTLDQVLPPKGSWRGWNRLPIEERGDSHK